jgi:predicted GNAT family acetyltransferase
MPLFGISTELKEEELEDVKQKTKKIAPECQSADT